MAGLRVTEILSVNQTFDTESGSGAIYSGSTLFPREDSETKARLDLESRRPNKPVDVRVSEATAESSSLNSSVRGDLGTAGRRSSLIKSYLESAEGIVESAMGLAEQAKTSIYTSADRKEWNSAAQELLSKIDKYFEDGEFGTEKILQGGKGTVSAGVDGETLTFTYGYVKRAALGIESIDLSTVDSATAAYSALESALGNLKGQSATVDADLSNMRGRTEALGTLEANDKSMARGEAERQHAATSLENSLAAVREDVVYAVDTQGSNIRSQALNAMFDGLNKIAGRINELAESKAQEESGETEKGKEASGKESLQESSAGAEAAKTQEAPSTSTSEAGGSQGLEAVNQPQQSDMDVPSSPESAADDSSGGGSTSE